MDTSSAKVWWTELQNGNHVLCTSEADGKITYKVILFKCKSGEWHVAVDNTKQIAASLEDAKYLGLLLLECKMRALHAVACQQWSSTRDILDMVSKMLSHEKPVVQMIPSPSKPPV